MPEWANGKVHGGYLRRWLTLLDFVWAAIFGAIRVQIKRMVMEVKTSILGDFVLAFLNLCVVELFNFATLEANEVIVVAAFVEFKNGATALKMMPLQ